MSLPSVREFYTDPDARRMFAEEHRFTSLDRTLDVLDDITEQSPHNLINYLDRVESERHQKGVSVALALGSIPTKEVFDAYGEEPLLWLVRSVHPDINHASSLGLEEYAGYNALGLMQARMWNWEQFGDTGDTHLLLRQYSFKEVVRQDVTQIDLEPIIRMSLKEPGLLGDKAIKKYGLIPLSTDRKWGSGPECDWSKVVDERTKYNLFLDAPAAFALTHKGRPVAVAALGTTPDNVAVLHQMQGVQPHRFDPKVGYSQQTAQRISTGALTPLDWHHVLVSVSEELAKSADMDGLAVQTGSKCKWTKPQSNEKEPHMNAEQAHRAYDVPAERLGFVRNSEDGNWYRPLAA